MAETARLVIAVDSTQAASGSRDLSALERQAGTTEIGIAKLAKTAAAAFAALKLGGIVEDAVTLASRYDQLGLVMKTVGANTGRTTVELAALDQSLQKAGISAIQSRNNIIKMMSANIDLTQATKLARLAQDAAVVGNTNSSEAFERLIKGIQSAEKETLETLGLNVNFQQSYEKLAAQLGKNADQLTTAEKTQAGVNAAMEAGKNIAGAYESSLDNANKKIQSSTRYIENLKVSLGGAAQPAFGVAVDGYVGSLKMLSDNVFIVSQLLETGLYAALGRGVAAAYTSAAAFRVDMKARQESAISTLALAEAEAVEAAANLKATTQRYAAYASHVEVTAATNADAAAQARLAAAQKGSSVTSAALMGAGGRLLGLMGGGVGLIAMAGAAALSFLDFGEESGALKARLADLDGPLDGLIARFTKLSNIEQVNQIEKTSKDLEALKAAYAKSGEDAGSAFVESLAKGMSGPRRSNVTVASGEIATAVDSVKNAFQETGTVDWSSLLSQLSNVNGISAAQLQIVKDLAGSREAEGRKIAEVESRLNALTGSYKANTDAATNNAIVTDTTGQKYIDQLKRQSDFAGKLTEVEKVRISISKGYAGTLSEADQKAALAYAGTVDKANAATAATKTLTSETNKHATAVENQAKALKDFEAQSAISTKSSNDMADAYLAGADSVRELSIRQEIEQEVLKTGAKSYDQVRDAVNALHDAKDRENVGQAIANLRVENANTVAQAAATLQGKDALESFNITKAMTIALSGKKIAVDSEEYKQLLATTKAQLEANKALERAGQVEGIVDRLNPQIKLLKDYTTEQEALNAAIARYPENAALYQDALVKLGQEYEVNQSKATLWGQMTEGAVDRIDGVFADAWANIGEGGDSLWDRLVKGAKQAFGEIAHMLTTKPLLASISNWLTGTDNGQGLSSVWGKLLGSAGGSSSESGSGMFSGLAGIGKNLYSAWNAITGVGSSVASGYASGGVSGAISGGAGYYGNILSNIAGTLSSGFTSLVGGSIAITGATAAGTAATTAALTGVTAAQAAAAAATVGAEGITAATLSAAVAEGAASVGANIGVAGATTAAASQGIGASISSAISSAAAMWPLAVVMGMYQSGKLYSAGVRPDAGEMWDSAGSTALGKAAMLPQTVGAKYFEVTDNILGKVVGGKMAAILSGSTLFQAVWSKVGSKLFGSGYETKDTGISLGVEGGVLDAQKYIQQKKKGGWISGSSKTKYSYADLDDETSDALGGKFNEVVLGAGGLFTALGIKLNESVLDGLNVASRNISSKGSPEWIQQQVDFFFAQLGDAAVIAISNATDAGLSGFSYVGLQAFVKNLQDVNGIIGHLNIGLYDMSVSGGFMAEQLSAWAGGIEALRTSAAGYYDKFYTDAEKAANTLSDVRKEFENLDITLPESRQGYRDMVEGIDKTTEAGRAMLLTLMSLSGDASATFDILESNAKAANQALAETLNGAVTGAMGTVQRAVSAEKDAATKAYNARVSSLNDMVSTATENVSGLTSVGNDLSAALKALRGDSDDAVKMLRAQAQATLQSALATARAGGSLAGITGLSDALDTVSNNNTDLYGSMEDFARDQGRTANVVAELNAINGKQLTTEEQLLASAQDQIKLAKDQFDEEMAKFDQQLELAQAQIDALNGIDNSVISVAAAMSGLSAAITAALAAKPAGSAAANTPANNSTLLDAVYQSVLGRDVDAAGAAYWGGLLQSGGIDYAGLVDAITKDAKANGELKIPGYAAGGNFGGGLRLVGENGPELEVTGPSRIYNANQTASMLKGGGNSGATAAEVRELRREMESNATYMAQLTKAVADGIDTLVNSGVQILGTVDTKAAQV